MPTLFTPVFVFFPFLPTVTFAPASVIVTPGASTSASTAEMIVHNDLISTDFQVMVVRRYTHTYSS